MMDITKLLKRPLSIHLKILFDMTQEEKAKAYDEALERAKLSRLQLLNIGEEATEIEYIFPELKESKDERIRNALIDLIKSKEEDGYMVINNFSTGSILAWLEKQEEKPQGKSALEAVNEEKVDNQNCVKSADKVEPKFHEGEWVIDKQGIVHQIFNVIENVTNHTYGYDIVGGGYFNDNTEGVRLWSINDARDGDVLVTNSNIIFIFKCLDEGGTIAFRASCTKNSGAYFPKLKERLCDQDVYPATKEQRDTLMKAMEHAGYTFDFEKKELKLLITNGGDFESENCEQKFDWSEVDDYNVQCLVAKAVSDIQKGNIGRNQELIDWLKSLKQRMEE